MSSSKQPLLRVRGITKRFPGVLALNGVDVSFMSGEVHALLGANGAGKSTLIKILAGVCRPDEGEILLDSEPLRMSHPSVARQHGISVIYQDFSLVPSLTVAENIYLGQKRMERFGLINWRKSFREAQELLDSIGVDFSARVLVRDLSTSQQQLVEIAKALSLESKVLILDEPTAPLSSEEVRKLISLVQDLRRKGVCIIYVTHRLEEVTGFADRVTILRDGEVVGSSAADELDRDGIVRLMMGEVQTVDAALSRDRNVPGAVLLELDGLTREKEFYDISFALRGGEVTVITGLVGSGRTELLETIFGARPAMSGKILVHGEPGRIQSPEDAIRMGIALIPEDRRGQGLIVLHPILTNISLAALRRFSGAAGIRLHEEATHARGMMQNLAIKAPGPYTRVEQLSGGNQQKVVLAKWLSTDARIFLFDEPTQGLDVYAKAEIHSLIHGLAHEKKGVLVVSSDLEEVLGIADRILVMHRGILVGQWQESPFDSKAIMHSITTGKAS